MIQLMRIIHGENNAFSGFIRVALYGTFLSEDGELYQKSFNYWDSRR